MDQWLIIMASRTASLLYKYPNIPETLGESAEINSSCRKFQNHQIQSRHHHGGVHHPHWCLSNDAWVVLCRPSGPSLVAIWLPLSVSEFSIQWSLGDPYDVSILWCVCWDPMNFEFVLRSMFLSMKVIWVFFDLLYAWFLIASYFFFDIWVCLANLIYLSCNGKRCFVMGSILRCLIPVTEGETTRMDRCY